MTDSQTPREREPSAENEPAETPDLLNDAICLECGERQLKVGVWCPSCGYHLGALVEDTSHENAIIELCARQADDESECEDGEYYIARRIAQRIRALKSSGPDTAAERAKPEAGDLECARALVYQLPLITAPQTAKVQTGMFSVSFVPQLTASQVADIIAAALAEARRAERERWFAQLRNLPEDLQRAMCKGWVPGPQEAATFIADWLEPRALPTPSAAQESRDVG